MKFSLSALHLVLLGGLFFLSGWLAAGLWFSLHHPSDPIYAEIYNQTDQVIPSVKIEHGNARLQEAILLVQLQPGERRVVALNHQPGQGFNVAVNYAHREKSEICAGKSKKHRFYRQTITSVGVYSTPVL